MTIPTGQGLGGTSNVNAGIVQPPLFPPDSGSWPDPWKSAPPQAIETLWHRLQEDDMLRRTQPYKAGEGYRQFKRIHRKKDGKSIGIHPTLAQVVPVGSAIRRNYYDARLASHPQGYDVEWILNTQVQRLLIQRHDSQE